MIYGKKGKQRLFVTFTYENGIGFKTMSIADYHGLSVKLLVEIQEYLEEAVKSPVVITNWKEIPGRK